MRDPHYDVLFEPIALGPVTAPNRFYQVPHCTGMGTLRPRQLAALRGMKAEGGWGVVCTEFCSIHPSSDDMPHPYATLWDDRDVKAHTLMTDKVHEHGSLAGVELWYGGASTVNLDTREVAFDVDCVPNLVGNPYHTRRMDKADIREFKRWHRNAALRAKEADFDIVYVYATHGYLLSRFLSRDTNTRTDEYGGSLENRVRLVRELIEETKDAVGDRCAVAVRFAADETPGEDGQPIHGERRDMFAMLAELPDLWDINIGDYSLEMGVSRFVQEGSLEPYMSYVKSLTSKPVVTVGRFTSPDTMVSQIKRGVVDLIGAARPSIADPFLPAKIREGRLDAIRECIGCNICYTGDGKSVPIRCTQNPTTGEEWRRGWHPEIMRPKRRESRVLIVGAGPAGLEAARGLGLRGYEVMLAEATRKLGGRVAREATLPGLGEWIRVRDYRVQQIEKMNNVQVFPESEMTADDVLDIGADHIAIATGATWRTDMAEYSGFSTVSGDAANRLLTPDDVLAGLVPPSPVLVFDTDHYYMGGALAEMLSQAGCQVTLATPSQTISEWCKFTAERWRVQRRLLDLGIELITEHHLSSHSGTDATLVCGYTQTPKIVAAKSLVMVGPRKPHDDLYTTLVDRINTSPDRVAGTLTRIGDCLAPAIIAAAVYSGHRYAQELEEAVDADNPLRHDRVFF